MKMLRQGNAEGAHLPLVTPMIGEVVYLDNAEQEFSEWWNSV